jgi:hypothetical protein
MRVCHPSRRRFAPPKDEVLVALSRVIISASGPSNGFTEGAKMTDDPVIYDACFLLRRSREA